MRATFQTKDGRTWRSFVNEFQQRKARCDQTGEVIDYPFIDPPPKVARKRVIVADGTDSGPYEW